MRLSGTIDGASRARWAALLGAVLTGCAISHPPPTDGELLERRILTARCIAELSCPVRSYSTPRDVDRCVELRWHRVPWRRRDAIDEGTALIDEDALDACLNGMACGVVPEECAHVTVGLTPTGGACAESEVCEPGTFCERRGGCGVCTPLLSPGERCRRAEECAPSSEGLPVICDRFGTDTCTTIAVREEPSGLDGPCGLQVIAPGRAERVSCGEAFTCESPGEVCVERLAPEPDIEIVSDVGGECGRNHPCDLGADLTCLGGTCQPISTRDGGRCDWLLCGPGLHCNDGRGATPICRATPEADGEPCTFDSDCASHRCVEVGYRGRCLPRVACD